MNVIFEDDTPPINNVSPINMCTGYKAKYLAMQKGDFENLRQLSHQSPVEFNKVMMQLEGRFKND